MGLMENMFADVGIFETPPFHINEIGVKFWIDRGSTNYAKHKGLKGVVVFLTEHPDGFRTRLITQNQKPIYDSLKMEDIGVYIDMMKMAESQ